MNPRWLMGLCSGASLDGVEAALVEAQGAGMDLRLKLAHFVHQALPRDLQEVAQRVVTIPVGVRQTSLAHRLLGELFAAVARQLADQAHVGLQKIQCLGCSGHTVWHEAEGRFPSTLALGMPAVVAERTGLTVVSDFRARDLATGGHGLPLTPLIDRLLFHQPGEHRVLVHLGSLASIVSLPADPNPRHLVGFQAGPCNLLLDGFIRLLTGGRETYDPGGKHAVQGCCVEPLLVRWLEHPLLHRRPPKMIDRRAFGAEFVQHALEQARHLPCSLHDLLCTATHFVARCITHALRSFLAHPPTRVLLSGGGVRNGFLWHLLEQELGPVPLQRTDAYGVPSAARKAMVFAGLAALTLDGVPANVMGATGAAGTRLLGSLTPGASANWSRCLAWMAAQNASVNLAAA